MGAAEVGLVERLRSNWFETAGDIAAMSHEDATALGVPLRLWRYIAQSLGAAPEGDDADPGSAGLGGGDVQHQAGSGGGNRLSGSASSSSVSSSSDGGAEPGAEEAVDPVAAVMQRRAPPRRRTFARDHIKVTKRVSLPPYGIVPSEMNPALREELAAFEAFSAGRFFGQRVEPVSASTCRVDLQYIRMMLGWLHRRRGVPLETLSLRSLFPSSDEASVAAAFDFTEFLITERKANPRTQFNCLITCVHVVRFLFHAESKPNPSNTREAPYSDLPVMRALKTLVAKAHKAAKKAPLVADERLKWLEWSEFLALIRELREECAGLTSTGGPRSPKEVALALQRYLVFAILSCIPDRQRTLRELEIGRTLFKEDGRWVIRHSPGDYKTGKLYGQRPPMLIAPFVYPELEAFTQLRSELNPDHNFLFSRAGGGHMTDKALYDMFVNTAQRRTGKATNPHLVRDMVVTHLRSVGTSENEMEALAMYMGHSISMQRDTYDRRTRDQKVSPAVALMDRLSSGTM
ncbi:hypothetical protein Rsub_10620 [Raphidocelis subcapitata]|uniref:Tyr recombinase domain-containing protein n=1 Tax=Raphidocelis subcapitata TaxID=307507 RepID=A0A2V0PKU8_9CHLO|nr:hypothetical protein Rsub_10620 [Raphidocelis subcapitata]|eukprot:GBF97947.1 hypothetical protein Rsub_10620 [Raphidocelis subcapitata]